MNKMLKKVFVICGCILLIGIGITGVGLISGGSLIFAVYPEEQKVYSAKDENTDNFYYIEDTVEVDAFDAVSIEADDADVVIKRGDSFQVYYNLKRVYKPTIKVENHKLSICSRSSKKINIVSLDLFGLSMGNWKLGGVEEKIVITVPQNTVMKDAVVKAGYGDIRIQQMQFHKLELDADSGAVDLSATELGNYKIKCEYGDARLMNCTGDSGSLILENGECFLQGATFKALQLNSEYGDVKLADCNITDYEVTGENGSMEMVRLTASKVKAEADYGDIMIQDSTMNELTVTCENGNADVELGGNPEDYALDIALELGEFTFNGKEQGTPYNANDNKNKKISIVSEYGDVALNIH